MFSCMNKKWASIAVFIMNVTYFRDGASKNFYVNRLLYLEYYYCSRIVMISELTHSKRAL